MTTVFINASPKKKLGASEYLLKVQRLFVRAKKIKEKLMTKADHSRILEKLKDADSVVFSLPLYVDGIPSHVLEFMEKMELFCKEHGISLKVYAISNGGFIEGKQNKGVLDVFKNFCLRSGNEWGGGIGVGGGVMLHVMRLVLRLQIVLLLARVLYNGIFNDDWLPTKAINRFVVSVLVILFFNLGVFLFMHLLGRAITKGRAVKNKYTRIMIPSFIFIPIAATFFFVFSVIKGGIFKGWLRKK